MSNSQHPPSPDPRTPQARPGRAPRPRLPTWAVLAGAGVLLLAAVGGGFALGAAQGTSGGSGNQASGGDRGREDDPDDGAAEQERAQEQPGLVGQDLEAYGIGYTAPEDWVPYDALPPHVSNDLDQPAVDHALLREDGTLLAHVSVTALSVPPEGEGPSGTTGAVEYLLQFVGPLNEGFESRGSTPYEVEGAPEATRGDFSIQDADNSVLVVDTGGDAYAALFVGLHEAAQPDEADEALREAILESVHVL